MADFAALTLTVLGMDLLAKAQAGAALVINRMAIGDGELGVGVELKDLTALVNERESYPVQSLERIGTGTVRVRIAFTNDQIVEGFPVREVGVFAEDPDLGEILYAVTNAGDNPDYLPAEGTTTVAEMQLDAVLLVDGVANITAVIDDSLIFATLEDLAEVRAGVAAELEAKAFYFALTV